MHFISIKFSEFCAIGLEDKVILTGGYESKYTAEVYNIDGFVEGLPQLQTQHYKHGCGHYINSDDKMVKYLGICFVILVNIYIL